jgi:hypothetical protein
MRRQMRNRHVKRDVSTGPNYRDRFNPGADRTTIFRPRVLYKARGLFSRKFASATSSLSRSPCPCSMEALESRTARSRRRQSRQPFSTSRLCLRPYAHRHRRLTASAVSDRASLERACHALAIGSSLRRHRLATSRGYGLLWLRRSRDNRGREKWRQTA